MNNIDRQYKELLEHILNFGVEKKDRTKTGTKSIFGWQIRHRMSEGFPLLTTKKMHFKSIVTELLWFLRGDTNIKYLVDNGCNIWTGDAYKRYKNTDTSSITFSDRNKHFKVDGLEFNSGYPNYVHFTQEEFINKIKTDDEFAERWGELGPIYGKQWRSWEYQYGDEYSGGHHLPTIKKQIDQIANLINDLKTNPDSRRMVVSAWAVHELDQMVLPPCHYGFQVYTRELSYNERIKHIVSSSKSNALLLMENDDKTIQWLNENNVPKRAISLMWNQRSVDVGLGWSFNVSSYSLLLLMIAKQVNMIPDEVICCLGDCHIYKNHIDGLKEQLNRVPYELPTVDLLGEVDDIAHYEIGDIVLKNYQSHPAIKLPLSN
jgi:thymidylate synthase